MKINNFESSGSEIKKFIEVSNEAGLSRKEKREVLKSTGEDKKQKPDSENTENENSVDNSGLLEKIDSQNVKAFMELIAGNEKIDYRALVDIGNNLREYGSRGNQEKILSPEDQKIISLITKYIENWFYSDGIIKMASGDGAEENKDLGSAAFIINQLAKIKEIPEYGESTANFDLEKLSHFIEEVSQNIPKFFSLEKVDADVANVDSEIEQEKKRLAEEFEIAKKAAAPFIGELGKLKKTFSETIKSAASFIEQNADSLPNDFHSEIEDIKMLCPKIKELKIPPGGVLIDSVVVDSNNLFGGQLIKNKIKTLIQFLRKEVVKEKELDSKKGAQKFSSFDALKNLGTELPKVDYKKFLDALEKISSKDYTSDNKKHNELERKLYGTGYYTLEREFNDMANRNNDLYYKINKLTSRYEYPDVINKFEESKKAVQESLEDKNGPGALYLIKSFLIAAAEMRRNDKYRKENREQEPHMFDPKAISNFSAKNKPVYDFRRGEQDRPPMLGSSFNEVHFEPKHTLFSLFAMEYQWQKYNKNI